MLLLASFAIVTAAIIRIAKLTSQLYMYSGDGISVEKIAKGKIDPEILAGYALANRVPSQASAVKSAIADASGDRGSVGTVLDSLSATENRFVYLCERSRVQLDSIKRANLLVFLLSLVIFAFGAIPTYSQTRNNSNLPQYLSLLDAVDQVLDTLALGLSLCIVLHLASGFLARTLSARRADWKYFFVTLKNELSRD